MLCVMYTQITLCILLGVVICMLCCVISLEQLLE